MEKRQNAGRSKTPIWRRGKDGSIVYYESRRAAAQANNTTETTISNLCKNGRKLCGRFHFSYSATDWSHCTENPYGHVNLNILKRMTPTQEIDSRIREMVGKPAKPLKATAPAEPKTEEDWEAMRQRAMQPFVCSISDEDIRRHEEEIRKRSIKAMKEEAENMTETERSILASKSTYEYHTKYQ